MATAGDEAVLALGNDGRGSGRATNGSHTNARRIVKPAHPVKTSVLDQEATSPQDAVDDDDDDGYTRGAVNHWESPSIDRERLLESAESQKMEHVRAAQERQKSKREQKQHERHLKSPKDKRPTTTTPVASFNPMSRFLSVFSLNSHPEHKRRAVRTDLSVEDGSKPENKRLRLSIGHELDARDPSHGNHGGPPPPDDEPKSSSPLLVAAAAMAIVAVLAALALRMKKKGI
jgi:hypothetical protein